MFAVHKLSRRFVNAELQYKFQIIQNLNNVQSKPIQNKTFPKVFKWTFGILVRNKNHMQPLSPSENNTKN